MFVPLLPLFIVGLIGVRDNEWKYGPKVIFNVKLDGVTPPIGALEKTVVFNATMKLMCRLRNILTLSCNYTTQAVALTVLKTVGNNQVVDHSRELEDIPTDEGSFELNFEPNNHDPIVISRYTNYYNQQIVRALVEHLRIGMDMTTRTTEGFDGMRNSTAGECPTTYEVTSTTIDKNGVISSKKNHFEIFLANGMREIKDQYKITRNLRECRTTLKYPSFNKVERLLKTSISHLTITESNFTSYTDYEVLFEDEDSASSGQRQTVDSIGRERVTVSFDQIVPADGPLTEIRLPKKLTLQTDRPFFSDCIEYMFPTRNLFDHWLKMAGDLSPL